MKVKCFGEGMLNNDHDYILIDVTEMQNLWSDKNIEEHFTDTADSNKPPFLYLAWPFGNLNKEEAIIFRDLIKKIVK